MNAKVEGELSARERRQGALSDYKKSLIDYKEPKASTVNALVKKLEAADDNGVFRNNSQKRELARLFLRVK